VLLARQISEYVSSHLSNLQSTLSVETRILDLTAWGRAADRAGPAQVLQLVYHQSDDFSVVALLDTVRTAGVVSAAFPARSHPETIPSEPMRSFQPRTWPNSPGMFRSRRFCARERGGTIFVAGSAHVPHVVAGSSLPGRARRGSRIIVAAVSLRRIADHLASLSSIEPDTIASRSRERTVASGRALGAARPEPKRLPQGKPGSLPPEWFVRE